MKIQEWQKGNESELTSLKRAELHSEWLKNLHKEIKESTSTKTEEKQPEIILGFVD